MIKTLIELQNVVLLSECKRWLTQHHKNDTLFLVKNIKEAINFLQSCPIDLFLIELSSNSLESAGLETLAALSFYYPSLKVGLLIPATFKKKVNERLGKLTSFYFINTPTTLKEFIHLTETLDLADKQSKPITQMKVADYFVLVEIREKTCLLAIETEDKTKKGIVFFHQGILYDAAYANIKAESAFIEIIGWKNVKISFKNLNDIDITKFKKKIQVSLCELINEGAKNEIKIHSLALYEFNDRPIDLLVEDFTKFSEIEERIKAELEAKAKVESEAIIKAELEAKAKAESEAKIKAELETKAKAESEAKIKAELDAKAKAESEAKIKAELEAKAKAESEAKIKAELEAKAKAESEAKIKAELEAKTKAESEAKIKAELEAKAKAELIATRLHKLELSEILKPLQIMDDYLASGIFDLLGNVFAKHSISDYNIDIIAKNAVALIECTLNAMNNIELGKCNFIQMNNEDCILEAIWVLEDQFAVSVLLKPNAKNTGLAKMYLAKASETIHEQLN